MFPEKERRFSACLRKQVEHFTRGESVFAAQNAIDGITVNTCHGEWLYQSWGINMQEDSRQFAEKFRQYYGCSPSEYKRK